MSYNINEKKANTKVDISNIIKSDAFTHIPRLICYICDSTIFNSDVVRLICATFRPCFDGVILTMVYRDVIYSYMMRWVAP